MKSKALQEVGGWVTDDRGFRLLDWALWLKLLNKGYIGTPTDKASFVAISKPSSVSNRGNEDYIIKKKWVLDNFG